MAINASPAQTMVVGSDTVCLEDDRLVIHAAKPMDWPVREFKRVPIYFQNRKYYLRAKIEAESPHAIRYELWPWTDEHGSASTLFIVYDESYVQERDAAWKTERRREFLRLALLPVYPLVGLFWSPLKRRVGLAVGFEPASLTKASVALVFNLSVAQGIFVGWLRGGLVMALFSDGRLLWADWILLALLAPDTVMRYSGLLRSETEYHLGFCEWLWPGRSEQRPG